MLSTYIQSLKRAFEGPLPGAGEHEKMMPNTKLHRQASPQTGITPKEGSVLILIYQKGEQLYFPLMLRPDYNGVHGGQVSLPGGKKEEKDKSFTATAIREAEEEIGVKSDEIVVLGQLTELYVFASNFRVIPIVAYSPHTPMFIPNPYEVEAIIEAPVNELLDSRYIKTTTLNVRGFELETPYFDFSGNVVWGATAMILTEFKALLEKAMKMQ